MNMQHRRDGQRRRLVPAATATVVAGVVTALVVGTATYALWSGEDTFAGGLITAGDLEMTTGTATWSQITPGVENPASGTLTTTPADFYSMPGDVIEIVQPVTTMLRGDNFNGGFTVDFANPDVVNEDVENGVIATSFHVEDADGVQVAPAAGEAEFGSVVVVPGLSGDDDAETDDWSVVVRIDVLGEYNWTTEAPINSPGAWAAGNIVVRLDQVRTGAGYSTAGGTQ
jgi:alternate signal-mediated exported protein